MSDALKAREALDEARKFIAAEYADASAEMYGEWLASEARPVFDKICTALADMETAGKVGYGPYGYLLKPIGLNEEYWTLSNEPSEFPNEVVSVPLFAKEEQRLGISDRVDPKIPTWPPLKKALWLVVTGESLNDGHYINAYDLTDKLYDAALSALDLSAIGAERWPTMDSAPKDGTKILIWERGSNWPEAAFWERYDDDVAEEAGEEGYWRFADDLLSDVASLDVNSIIGWRPLPSPPEPRS